MTLAELQRRMGAIILGPLAASDGIAERTRDGRATEAEAEEFIKPNDRLTSLERLEIYNRQYWFRVLDSLYDDFPGLYAVLGEDAFDRLSRAYLADCPSRSFTMRNLGSRLAEWLGEHPEYAGRNPRLALDMARLEWAHIEAFDGPERKPVGPEDLLEPGAGLRLTLQPHMSLLELQYPVDDLRIEVNESAKPHATASNAVGEREKRSATRRFLRLKPRQIYLAVYRSELSVWYRRLDAGEFRLLKALREGKTIGEAVEAAVQDSQLAEHELGKAVEGWFATWSELGCFCCAEEE
jgi:hypothetical protein